MQSPKVSLIVPVWTHDDKTLKMTIDAINSMERTTYPNYDIIIVDDCSPYEKTFNILQQLYQEKHQVVRTPKNGGSTEAINYGIKFSDAPFIQYQNNDVRFDNADWLTEQMKLFSDLQVGVVGCFLRYPSGLIQHAGAAWRDQSNHIIDHIGQYKKSVKYFEDVPFVTGCGMTVRREILEKNGGGFTVFKGYGWDDIDIEVKAKQWGYKVKVAHKAEFLHFGSVTYRQRPELIKKENLIENSNKFKDIPINEQDTLKYFIDNYYEKE